MIIADLLADAQLAAAFEHSVEILSSNTLSSNEKKRAQGLGLRRTAVEDKVWLRQLPTSERQVMPVASLQAALKLLNESDRFVSGHIAITFPAVEEPRTALGFEQK